MNESHDPDILRDPRISAHITSPLPAWLWSDDASRLLWANAAGMAAFCGSGPGELNPAESDAYKASAQRVAQLASELAPDVAPRLAQFQGFGSEPQATLPCLCSRIQLAEGPKAILVVCVADSLPSSLQGQPTPEDVKPATSDGSAHSRSSGPRVEERPQLTVVPTIENVLPFRPNAATASERRPILTPVERNAFHEIAKALGARFEAEERQRRQKGEKASSKTAPSGAAKKVSPASGAASPPREAFAKDSATAKKSGDLSREAQRGGRRERIVVPSAYAMGESVAWPIAAPGERAVLDRIPSAAIVHRGGNILYANSVLLEWTGYESIEAVAKAGGLEHLFADTSIAELDPSGRPLHVLALTTREGDRFAADARLFAISWYGNSASLIVLTDAAKSKGRKAAESATLKLRLAELERAQHELAAQSNASQQALAAAKLEIGRLEAILGQATDGVLVVDRDGTVLSSNAKADGLFGYASGDLINRSMFCRFSPESRAAARDYFFAAIRGRTVRFRDIGPEVAGLTLTGEHIALAFAVLPIGENPEKFAVIVRNIGAWKRAEEALTDAKRQAENASSAKSDFLAKVSHEIRTPLNSIIGFSEVMMEERFGAIGNARYLQYVKDIHASGQHVISLVNDLLDLSKVEAGKLDLNPAPFQLNDVIRECVAVMEPESTRQRVVVRASLADSLSQILADKRSVRQMVLNLLSNSLKFTGPGGQIIVSSAPADLGEVVLRVRDTGVGMTEKEVATALEPFRQIATSGRQGSGGTGLGLPLTKALAEANQARFTIKSTPGAGTLVEIAFPASDDGERHQA